MDQITAQLIITGVVEVLMLPILVFILKHFVGKRLDQFDEKRDEARMTQTELEHKKLKQREAERTIILAISRTMLLDNWEKCMDKGYYTLEEREVYHELYKAYKNDDGNGIIEEIAPRIRALPMEPPKNKEA